MNAQTFLRYWSALLVTTIFLVGSFNLVIDPYGFHGSPRIDGVNAYKTTAHSKVRQIKPVQLIRNQPKTVLIGNSRPEAGLNPTSHCWPDNLTPVYNFGIPGAGLAEQFDNAMAALRLESIHHLLIAIDFADFLTRSASKVNEQPDLQNGREDIRSEASASDWLQEVHQVLAVSLSLDALADSVATIVGQYDKAPTDITAQGFNNGGMFATVVAHEGQGALFAQKMNELRSRYRASVYTFDASTPATVLDLAGLTQVIDVAKASDVTVTLVINPYHQAYLDVFKSEGYFPAFKKWKEEMTSLAIKSHVALWDFSERSSFVLQRDDNESGSPTTSKWFWEPAHYKAELGDRMLARLFQTCSGLNVPGTFGKRLSSSTMQ